MVKVLQVRALFEDFGRNVLSDRDLVKAIELVREAKEYVGKEKLPTDKAAFKEMKKKEQDPSAPQKKKKLSYKELRELEQLEKDLEMLGNEKKELEEKLSGGTISAAQLNEASVRIGEVMALLDEKEMRWLELNDN